MKDLQIQLKTLTPLWTGGVDQTCDRLHETGLIGSLRWWYEALVRGLGGYACDPTAEGRCEYDPKKPAPPEKQLCAACYLFGCTGWARLFRLQVMKETTRQEPLHFYTTLDANKRWLGSIFGGEKRNYQIGGMTVPFGEVCLAWVGRGQDEKYAFAQLAWALDFAAKYGGLGAKLQHGFGQIALITSLTEYTVQAEQDLRNRLSKFKKEQNNLAHPTRQRFFSYSLSIPSKNPLLQAILQAKVVGSKPQHATYVPCAFDLRYKGDVVDGKKLGFRQWLISRGWRRDEVHALLGETKARRDEERLASRICFGMPWQNQGVYTLRVFGFVPPELDMKKVEAEVKRYLDYLFGTQGGE